LQRGIYYVSRPVATAPVPQIAPAVIPAIPRIHVVHPLSRPRPVLSYRSLRTGL